MNSKNAMANAELVKRIEDLQGSIEHAASKLIGKITRNGEPLTCKERETLQDERQRLIHNTLRGTLIGRRGRQVRLTEEQYRRVLSAIDDALTWRSRELQEQDLRDPYWRERRSLEQRLHELDKDLRASWVVRAIWEGRPLWEFVQFFTFGEALCPHGLKRKQCKEGCNRLWSWPSRTQRVRDREPSMDRPAHRPREFWVDALLLPLGAILTDSGMTQLQACGHIEMTLCCCCGIKRDADTLVKRLRWWKKKR